MQTCEQRSLVRRGFTLIELVVVLIIIATLAGLVLPNVSMLGRSADMAATASSQRELANNIQLFFILQKRYPQGFDSLIIDGTSSIYVPADTSGGIPTSEATQIRGLPVSGPSLYADLTVETLTSNQRRSFTRGGFDWVYDHDTSVANSNDSGIVQRNLPSSGTMQAAVVTPGDPVALKLLPGTDGVPPDGTQIVAVGIGPRNTAIGKTIQMAPIYPGCDGSYYGRFIAFFLVYETGERATLLGVTDSYGRAPDYSIQQFIESLPNDSRQG